MSDNSEVPKFPFAREHGYEPSPTNERVRNSCPVSQVELFDGTKAWIVMKHKDCITVLDSDKVSADRRQDGYPEIHQGGKKAKDAKLLYPNLDDPEHAKQRNMLQSTFDPDNVEKLRPMMQDTVDAILDKLLKKGGSTPIDFIEEFATPVPTQIIYKLLGVPDEDIEVLSKDSEVRTSTSAGAAESSNKHLKEYMGNLVQKKIDKPQKDIISKLVTEQLKPGNITKDDVTDLAFLVLTAGNAALTNSIGLGTLSLLQHPEQADEIKKEPDVVAPDVVNEILRYHTVSAVNGRRVAIEDFKLGGMEIKKGSGIICSVQSASRDPTRYAAADNFDIHRKLDPSVILGFGHGKHRCQAEYFARAQLEIAFASLFKKMPNLKLAVEPDELEYTSPTQNVGVHKLPVTF